MAHIPMDHVSQLWSEIQLNTWQELRQALEQRREKPDGIANELVVQVIEITEVFESSNKPFPESPNQLYEELNQTLHHA